MLLFLVLAFAISALSGSFIIKKIVELGYSQTERNVGAVTHLEKEGTPIMGGFIFLISLFLLMILYISLTALGYFSGNISNALILLLSTFLFGIIGFIDDYIKAVKKRNLGLDEKQKLIMQFVFALIIIGYQMLKNGSSLLVPFVNVTVDLKIFIIPLYFVAILGTVNSVNLLDGLDGLASSVTAVYLVFYVFIGSVIGAEEISVFSILLIGSLLGFLVYNKHPAKIFMGDTGSMALGGAVACLAVITDTYLFVPIVGLIYLIEALSVMLQVSYYKKTKKRIFLMAPIHYHFEKKGMKETSVVFMFIIVQIIMTTVGILSVLK